MEGEACCSRAPLFASSAPGRIPLAAALRMKEDPVFVFTPGGRGYLCSLLW